MTRSLAISLMINGLLAGLIIGYVVDRYVLHDCEDCSFLMSE